MSGRRLTIDTGAGEILFRLPNVKDIKAAREPIKGLPTLPDPDAVAGKPRIDEDDADRYMEMADVLLIRCALRPRLLRQAELDVDNPNEVGIEELSESSRAEAFGKLMVAAGFSKEAAEEVRPFSETPPPS